MRLIIAADNAKFGQPEIKLGVIPGIGGTQRLTRAVGKAKAMDLILTGRMMDAHEAERAGLVARVVPLANLLDEAMKTAETIASMSLPSVMAAKEAVNARIRDVARRGRALRAARVPLAVRDRRSEGRHGRLHRQAAGEIREQIGLSFRRRRTRLFGGYDRQAATVAASMAAKSAFLRSFATGRAQDLPAAPTCAGR